MLLRGSRRGRLNLGSLLMAVVLCDVGSRRAARAQTPNGVVFLSSRGPGVLWGFLYAMLSLARLGRPRTPRRRPKLCL